MHAQILVRIPLALSSQTQSIISYTVHVNVKWHCFVCLNFHSHGSHNILMNNSGVSQDIFVKSLNFWMLRPGTIVQKHEYYAQNRIGNKMTWAHHEVRWEISQEILMKLYFLGKFFILSHTVDSTENKLVTGYLSYTQLKYFVKL